MITIIKKEIKISKELLSKIRWACAFSKSNSQITNGNLRIETNAIIEKNGEN